MVVTGTATSIVRQHLEKLTDLNSLKRFLTSVLNYEISSTAIPRIAWPADAATALNEDPIIIATGASGGEFHIIYCRLDSDRLPLTAERPVVNQLLKDHPYALFAFSNKTADDWHLINVKYDNDSKRRKLFRRIRISKHEQLRTASERLALIVNVDNLTGFQLQSCHDEAFDVDKVTENFFAEYKRIFEYVENSIIGFSRDDKEALRLFTQKLFNRLMFIAFIQKKGWLKFNQRTDYLQVLWKDYNKNTDEQSNFYHDRLHLLFFAGLNNASSINLVGITNKGILASLIGEVPYLNGGLFEREDDDADAQIVIPDKCFELIIEDLFSAFNFTVMESTPLDVEVAVDPEMLGKIFERLVTGRHESGSYYTPKSVVSFMCREALKAYLGNYHGLIDKHDVNQIGVTEARELLGKLTNLKICDPACGSGAYLVGMMHEMHQIMSLLDTRSEGASARDNYHLKLDIIQNNLYGVDIDQFAVNIARLRLWLTLAVEHESNMPEPLPNLDFKLEYGNSLTAPSPEVSQQVLVGELAAQLKTKTSAYMRAHDYGVKAALKNEINDLHNQIRGWTHVGYTVSGFDWAVEFADVFAKGGFDIILANPPYGIACADPLRFQYFPRVQGEDIQSKDSYGLFIARGLQLLKDNGILTYIVSDTWRTIRTHRPLRKKLVSDTSVLHVLDLPSWIFDATVNTCILTAVKAKPSADQKLIAGDLRNLPKGDWATLEKNLVAISGHGPDCSTTTYARYTYPQNLIKTYDNLSFFIGSPELYKLMSDPRFVKLGDIAEVKQGLATADNKYYLRKRPNARGSYQILDETKLLTEQEIQNLSDDEKIDGVDPASYGGRHFVPYDKGGASDTDEGWLPNYWVPTEYFIDWSISSCGRLRNATIADVKRRKGLLQQIKPSDERARAAVIRNQNYYFRSGITFSWAGVYSPTFRYHVPTPFDHGSSCLFSISRSREHLLSRCCSMLGRYLMRQFINHTINFGVDDVKGLILEKEINPETDNRILSLVNDITQKQRSTPRYPYYLMEQLEIESLIFQIYMLNEEDIREVELWYCRRYPKLAEAQGVIAKVKTKYAEHLERCDLVLDKGPDYWKSHPVLELISQGECINLEFKETLEADAENGQKNQGVMQSTLKTIAAFLNTDGGTLIIGITDSGEIKGLTRDYNLCNIQNKDGFEQKLRHLIADRISPSPFGEIVVSFHVIEGHELCKVDVNRNRDIVHLDNRDIYIRDGNVTRKLEGLTRTEWIRKRK